MCLRKNDFIKVILLYLPQRSTNRPEDNKAGSNTTRATPCKPKRKRVKKESTEKAASLSLGQVNGGVDKKMFIDLFVQIVFI